MQIVRLGLDIKSRKGERAVKLIIEGNDKEIAALVVGLQEQRKNNQHSNVRRGTDVDSMIRSLEQRLSDLKEVKEKQSANII